MVQAADQQNFAPMAIIITSQLASLHVGTNQPTLYYTYTPPPPPPPPPALHIPNVCISEPLLLWCNVKTPHVFSCLLMSSLSLSCTFICNVILFVNSAAYVWPPRGMCDLPPPPPPPPGVCMAPPEYVMNYSVQQPQYDGYCT